MGARERGAERVHIWSRVRESASPKRGTPAPSKQRSSIFIGYREWLGLGLLHAHKYHIGRARRRSKNTKAAQGRRVANTTGEKSPIYISTSQQQNMVISHIDVLDRQATGQGVERPLGDGASEPRRVGGKRRGKQFHDLRQIQQNAARSRPAMRT